MKTKQSDNYTFLVFTSLAETWKESASNKSFSSIAMQYHDSIVRTLGISDDDIRKK